MAADVMNVIASYMCSPETPARVQANFAESVYHGTSAFFVQEVRQLIHLVTHCSDTIRTGFRQSVVVNMVIPVC